MLKTHVLLNQAGSELEASLFGMNQLRFGVECLGIWMFGALQHFSSSCCARRTGGVRGFSEALES